MVRQHIEPALGKHPLVRLSPQHIQAFLHDKLRSGLSAKMVRHLHATLRGSLNVAMRWGLIVRNVASLTSPPRLQTKEIHPMGQDEVRVFLETIKGDRLEVLFLVALSLGLRRGELLGLRWQDVDF